MGFYNFSLLGFYNFSLLGSFENESPRVVSSLAFLTENIICLKYSSLSVCDDDFNDFFLVGFVRKRVPNRLSLLDVFMLPPITVSQSPRLHRASIYSRQE